jgi:hypothetical protein
MTAKKRAPKPAAYVPNAIDADGDGLVQDGTEFERPVGTEIDYQVTLSEDDLEQPEELEELEVVQVVETPEPGTHKVLEGENILTIAERYLPEGMTRKDYAAQLYAANGDFHHGKTIRL